MKKTIVFLFLVIIAAIGIGISKAHRAHVIREAEAAKAEATCEDLLTRSISTCIDHNDTSSDDEWQTLSMEPLTKDVLMRFKVRTGEEDMGDNERRSLNSGYSPLVHLTLAHGAIQYDTRSVKTEARGLIEYEYYLHGYWVNPAHTLALVDEREELSPGDGEADSFAFVKRDPSTGFWNDVSMDSPEVQRYLNKFGVTTIPVPRKGFREEMEVHHAYSRVFPGFPQ